MAHLRFSPASSAGGMVSSDHLDGVFHSAAALLLPTQARKSPDSPAGFLESGRGYLLVMAGELA
jgi:hypothetical protein